MSAKRVVARCPDCGAEISVPVNVVGRARCGACRAERARADKRAYAARRKAADAEGYRRAQAAAQRASYARQKAADPAGFLARQRERNFRYRQAGVEARGACPPDGGPGSPCPNAGTQAGFVSRSQGGEKGDRERHYGLAGPKAPIAGMPAPACAGHVASLRAAAGVFRQNPMRQMSGGGRSAVRT